MFLVCHLRLHLFYFILLYFIFSCLSIILQYENRGKGYYPPQETEATLHQLSREPIDKQKWLLRVD